MPQQVKVLKKLLVKGFNVSPEALELLSDLDEKRLNEVLELLSKVNKTVIRPEDVIPLIEDKAKQSFREKQYSIPSRINNISVIKAPRELGVKGTVDEFVDMVRNRFEFLKSILIRKSEVDPIPIADLKVSTRRNGDRILIIGMVMEKRVFRDFSIRMVLDDETGSIPVIFKKNGRYWDKADKIPLDSVLAVKGTFLNGRVYAESLRIPDLEGSLVKPGSVKGKAVLISDTHIGSKYFNEKSFDMFIKWLNSDSVSDVRYIIICGDLVDGIGVYPSQEDELKIKDVYKQFGFAATFLERVPKSMKVIYIPGNHEPVRQAEPQPIIPSEYLDELLEVRPDLISLPNPSMIGIGDVRILLYHGRSLNAIFKHIPGLQPIRPETVVEAMTWMLKLRHLAPIYGEHPVSPEKKDWLLIDEVPHILHTGHIHVYGLGEYKGVKLVNSGTFENETPYIKSLGIEVTVGKVPVVDLGSLKVKIENFA